MINKRVYNFSKSDITRYIILDHSLLIEELVNETIGRLLDIDFQTSKSLGYSSSISFNQKILLIQDKVSHLANTNNQISNKIERFCQIRNKFLHLNKINDWDDFFSISKTYSKIEKELEKWYEHKENLETNKNDRLRLLYFYLTIEIFYSLIEINLNWAQNKGKRIAKEEVNQMFFDFIKKKNVENELISQLWSDFINYLKDVNPTKP